MQTKSIYGTSEVDHVMTVTNGDGTTKIYDYDNNSVVIPAVDFSMLRSDIKWGFFNTYQLKDGKLVVTVYDSTENALVTSHGLEFYNMELGYIPAENIKEAYIYYDAFAVLKNDGTMYFFTSFSLFNSDEDEFILSIFQYFDILHNIDQAVSTDDSSVVFYTVAGDNQFIYHAETNFATQDHLGKCNLPEGYVASDIEKVSCTGDIYMFMSDGTVFYAPDVNDNPAWIMVDILTEMNQSGELKAFRNRGMSKIILKSDVTLYSLIVTEN